MFSRHESSISTCMGRSSCFVFVFPVSLRLTGSSAQVALRLCVEDFAVNRFFTREPSCVSVRLSPPLELEAPGVIVVSDGSPQHLFVSRWLLCGFLLLIFMHFWYCRWRSKRVSCRRDVQCFRLGLLLESFLLTSCARRVVVRFERVQLLHRF